MADWRHTADCVPGYFSHYRGIGTPDFGGERGAKRLGIDSIDA
jgi:hypothetical protein